MLQARTHVTRPDPRSGVTLRPRSIPTEPPPEVTYAPPQPKVTAPHPTPRLNRRAGGDRSFRNANHGVNVVGKQIAV